MICYINITNQMSNLKKNQTIQLNRFKKNERGLLVKKFLLILR